jgi:hypothetical protein
MEQIEIKVYQDEVYDEVAKATAYTGAKLIESDEAAPDRMLVTDADLETVGDRFWAEAAVVVNERLNEMFVSGETKKEIAPVGDTTRTVYDLKLEVSTLYDKNLNASVQEYLKGFFIYAIVGQWFKYANKDEAEGYITKAGEKLSGAEKLLYSRKRPKRTAKE